MASGVVLGIHGELSKWAEAIAVHPATMHFLGRFVLLRVATHMYDYAAYVGWHDDLTRYADLFVELFDTGPEAVGAPAGGSGTSLARRAPGSTGGARAGRPWPPGWVPQLRWSKSAKVYCVFPT